MKTIIRFLNKPFNLLTPFYIRMTFAGGIALFCTLFLYLYSPFNITVWIGEVSPFRSLALPVLLLAGSVTILISQLLQAFLWKERITKRIHLVLGFLLDVSFLTASLGILYGNPVNRLADLIQIIRLVAPILFLCYLIGLNLLALFKLRREQALPRHEVTDIKKKQDKEQSLPAERLNITDENGQLRLSLRPTDLLYIESADNYVIVYFRKEQRIAKELIRNSLKNMEELLGSSGCIRCHRSYLVNMAAVYCLRKTSRSFDIEIGGLERTIPVSRSYVGLVKEALQL